MPAVPMKLQGIEAWLARLCAGDVELGCSRKGGLALEKMIKIAMSATDPTC